MKTKTEKKTEVTEPIFEFKSFKPAYHLSEETIAFTANIYLNGKKVGEARNSGQGGCNDIYWSDKNAQKQLADFLDSLPEKPYSFDPERSYKIDEDSFFSELVNRYGRRKELQDQCKGKVCFHPKEWDGKTYRYFACKAAERDRAREIIFEKYPDSVIMNDGLNIPVNSKGIHLDD